MNLESARSKAEAVARMYFLGNRVVEPLGPGSKEKKSALVALGRFVDLDLTNVAGKHECGRLIANKVAAPWDNSCTSAGDTVTLMGLNRLVDGAVEWHLRSGRRPARSLVRDLASLNPAPRWDDNPEDEHMAEDLSEIEQNIAEDIVQLASGGTTPKGVTVSSLDGLKSSSITLRNGSWRTPLSAVQGWLHLPGEIEDSSDEAFDRSLGEMLGGSTGSGWTDPELFNSLQERLERAASLRTAFLDRLEDEVEGSATLATASADWEDAWLDVQENEEAETSGPIQASADTWHIAQFRQKAADRELELNPSYQRADVWPTADAQLLIESVLRGIPLPSVILLQENTDEGDKYEIVDGKQRLTAILRFTASHPKARDTVEAKAKEWDAPEAASLFVTDYPAFKKLWRKHETEPLSATSEKNLYFPFPVRSSKTAKFGGELEQVRGHYYSEIRHIVIRVGNTNKKVKSLFEEVSNYRIPVIVYEEATSRQIHEVFSLYNKQGKHLNAEEIRNAAFHELDFMRALLATAGDTDGVEQVAPFLKPIWDDLSSTGPALAASPYSLPDAGYKRTKALSWTAATILMEDEGLAGKSTATHINSMLKRLQENPTDPLRERPRVRAAMALLDKAVDAHQSIPSEAWSATFINAQRTGRWQELQLVASLVALAAAYAVRGDELDDDIDERMGLIKEASEGWQRPSKTQSREQWMFIGKVVKSFLDLLEVDADAADTVIRHRFGSSGLNTLIHLPSSARPK